VLPTVDIIRRKAAHAGLELVTHQPFGLDYAKTLSLWRERFLAAWPSIERLGFDQRFKRMWEYYLCYCEAGFKNGIIDVGFYKFTSLPTRAISRASAC
jgi:cyclopropane-fatty-acyl-phospholipid synthase